MSPRPRLVTAGLVLSGMLVLSLLGVMSSDASLAASGKVSAHLTKTSLTAAQAANVKLVCKFSPASTRWGYLLSLKKGAKWVKVRSVNKTGSFKGSYTMTVKKLFGSKAVKVGQYRVKVSADANSVTRSFKVVKATSGAGSGDGSNTTPPLPTPPLPGAFNKAYPANGATGQWNTPSLSWGTSSDAASYEYCIDTTNNNACDGSWVSTNSATIASRLSGLTLGTTYYWQVQAKNAQGTTAADGGSWFSFSTLAALPSAFNKTSPANGATSQPTSPSLSWGTSSNAASYEYCIDTTNNNACDGSWVSTNSATSASLSGLTLGTTYYWQVQAKNARGTTAADGGSWFSFSTLAALPSAGHWTTSDHSVGFYVTPNQTNVTYFALIFSVSGCGTVTSTRTYLFPIVNGGFSATGEMYFSGTFDSPTSAHGTVGLDNWTGPGCFGTIQAWQAPWTATWQDASQPS